MSSRRIRRQYVSSALRNASDSSSPGSSGVRPLPSPQPQVGVDGRVGTPAAEQRDTVRSPFATAQVTPGSMNPPALSEQSPVKGGGAPSRPSQSPASAGAPAANARASGVSTHQLFPPVGVNSPAPSASRSPPSPPKRTGSIVGERLSVSERRAAAAQAIQEMVQQLAGDIRGVEEKISGVERELEGLHEALENGGSYRGRSGAALATEGERLALKERQLREEKGQLRQEKLELIRSQNNQIDSQQRRGSEGSQKRVSLIVTQSHVDDPPGERAEQKRLSRVEETIAERRQSINSGAPLGDEAGNDSVFHVYKIEEDPRLLVRVNAFNLPILVATLLSGFTLVLFDVAETTVARRLGVLSFAVEMSASTVLCLIVFRAQQLYARATDLDRLTGKFLRKMTILTIFSLIMFWLGMVVFVAAFVVEITEEMGDSWLAVLAIILFPTVLAGLMFAASTVQVRRHSHFIERRPDGQGARIPSE